WGAVGFRSPSCLRNASWMKAMKFAYDSSFPDTDPHGPQPGGCCSPWPYFISNLVELPLTMPQDHTLYEILGHADLRVWEEKANWIEQVGGLVVINAHPDYINSRVRLQQYERFLLYMKQRCAMWHALPREVAAWWRARDASVISMDRNGGVVSGPASSSAWIASLTLDATGYVRFDGAYAGEDSTTPEP